ncbi:unnamed protein product, partial [Ectocarpus sp. 6 AP-2014]
RLKGDPIRQIRKSFERTKGDEDIHRAAPISTSATPGHHRPCLGQRRREIPRGKVPGTIPDAQHPSEAVDCWAVMRPPSMETASPRKTWNSP